MESYLRTDLATELINDKEKMPSGIKRAETFYSANISKEKIYVSKEGGVEIGKPKGTYVTINCGKIMDLDESFDLVSDKLSEELISFAEKVSGRKLSENFKILVVGLGNENMTPDSIGPGCVDRITVTRQLQKVDSKLFHKIGCCSVSAFAPGSMGQTGIETSELVLGAVRSVEPDVVIAVDALAARSAERLGSTVQISDTGIHPGSGVGNRRKGLTKENLGVPVIALGVPTVVDSSTLIKETLDMAGVTEINETLLSVLRNRKSYFVAPKECDALAKSASRLLASAINSAFGINLGNEA